MGIPTPIACGFAAEEAKRMARRGQVKFNVRHNALLLHDFTVADMVRATSLNAESVRTELQKMREEGFLTSQPYPKKSGRPGGQLVVYRLTDDPTARAALAQSIEAFSPPQPSAELITGQHYLLARQLLNRAQTAAAPCRAPVLADAAKALVIAAQTEGGSRASERVKACLQYEEARLAYLEGAYQKAGISVAVLREFFVSIHDDMMLRHVDELRMCLEAVDRLAAQRPGHADASAGAHYVLEALADYDYHPESPLAALALDLLRRLVRTPAPEHMHMLLYGEFPLLQPHTTAEMTATYTSRSQAIHNAYFSLARVLPGSGPEAESHLSTACIAFQLERYDEALKNFSRAIELAPAHALPVASRGETFRQMQRYDEALSDLSRAIDMVPDFAWAIASRAHVYWTLWRYDEALTDFGRAIQLVPDYSWAIASRGQVYRTLGRYDEALADFSRAMGLIPGDASPVAGRGQVYRTLGRYDEALADFSRAIDLAQDDAWPVAERGYVYWVQGRYDEALVDFDQAIHLDPDYAAPVVGRCLVYQDLGHSGAASADCKRVQAIFSRPTVRRDLENLLARTPVDHPLAEVIRKLLHGEGITPQLLRSTIDIFRDASLALLTLGESKAEKRQPAREA